jgi:hypothetical protein
VDADIKSWVERLDSLRKCVLEPEKCTHDTNEKGEVQKFDYASIDMCLGQIISEMEQYLNICELCERAFEPEEINGLRKLKTFKGYTVDLRLQQFRKLVHGKLFGDWLDFIEFASPKGKKLLTQMHEKVTR